MRCSFAIKFKKTREQQVSVRYQASLAGVNNFAVVIQLMICTRPHEPLHAQSLQEKLKTKDFELNLPEVGQKS